MLAFNNTSKVITSADQSTGTNGVVLPHSSRVLLESDINVKIERTKNDIEYFSNAQSQKKSGGKRFRTRQNSLQSQVKAKTKRLALLTLALPLAKTSISEEYSIAKTKIIELSQLIQDMELPKYLKNPLDKLFENEIIFDLEMERIPNSDNLFNALTALNEINQAVRYKEQYNNILALCTDLKSLFNIQIKDLIGSPLNYLERLAQKLPTNCFQVYDLSHESVEEAIEKTASFVSKVYAKFPRANEQQRKELIANNILINDKCEQLSELECDHFQKALKEKIIALLKEKKWVKISTRYYPEEILRDVCKDIFINPNELGWVFPHKTSATIELNDNKLSLMMNFQEKIYHI